MPSFPRAIRFVQSIRAVRSVWSDLRSARPDPCVPICEVRSDASRPDPCYDPCDRICAVRSTLPDPRDPTRLIRAIRSDRSDPCGPIRDPSDPIRATLSVRPDLRSASVLRPLEFPARLGHEGTGLRERSASASASGGEANAPHCMDAARGTARHSVARRGKRGMRGAQGHMGCQIGWHAPLQRDLASSAASSLNMHESIVGSSLPHIQTCEANGGKGAQSRRDRAVRSPSMSGAGARGMCSRAMSVRGADRRMGRVRRSNGQQGRVEGIATRATQLGGGGGVRTDEPG